MMLLTPWRFFALLLCSLVIIFSCLSAFGEITGNEGLWTLGGKVGMARLTIFCFIALAVAIAIGIVKANGGPPYTRQP